MKCSKCGTENQDSNRFCGTCGTPLAVPEQPQQTGRAMRSITWVIIVATGVFIGLVMCVVLAASLPVLTSLATYDVEYYVYSPEGVLLTYTDANGDTMKIETWNRPWTLNFKARGGTPLYLSAQTTSYGVHCEIRVNGLLFKQAVSQGKYAVATCNGRLP